MTQSILSVLGKKNCHFDHFLGQNDSFESFRPKNLGQILVPPVFQFF